MAKTSDCCDDAKNNEALRWADPDDFYDTGNRMKCGEGMPIGWYWTTAVVFEGTTGLHEAPVTRCPWCGSELPQLAAAEPPAEVQTAYDAERAAARDAAAAAWSREPPVPMGDAAALCASVKDAFARHAS